MSSIRASSPLFQQDPTFQPAKVVRFSTGGESLGGLINEYRTAV